MDGIHLIIILLLLSSGVLAGLSAGLLGAGGGLVVVPLVSLILLYQGVPRSIHMQIAIGTSLAIMILSSSSSVYTHTKNHNVRYDFFLKMIPGLIIGAIIGSLIANYLPGGFLHKFFGIVVLIAAFQMAFNLTPKFKENNRGWLSLLSFGIFSGSLSSCLGIGGSIVNVPYFKMNHMEMKQCVATSSATSIPTATIGTLVFLLMGLHHPHLPIGSIGFINIPILIIISLSSIVAAWVGAKWANRMNEHLLRLCFAGFLTIVGTTMLLT